MRACARCGQENPEGFRFCGACGAPLEDAEAPREVRKTVTVVFCDLTGSTALGERLDPETVRATMRRYFEDSRGILERHGGTVEKFIGDAVMAVFGVPQAHEDDALRAVRAAVELRAAVATIGLKARIGVNTGEVVAGEGDALVTGDAVNVAARLEQNAEPGEILIGQETQQLVRDAVQVEAVELELKGKSAPVSAHRLLHIDSASAGLVRRLDSPLVGRERELQRLRDDFDNVVSQRSSYLFTLLGPAGVGKSRLVEEFIRESADRARILRGHCLHYGEGITYWPLVEVLLQLGADAEAVLALPSPNEAAVATRKLLEAEAAERPLVVVWDDIQWGEPTFLDLIEHLADWSRGAPIFVLCVARPELLQLRPAWGGGKANATSLLLEPLGSDETSTLIDNLLGDGDLPDTTRSQILRASEGNPLYVEEMLMLRGDGDSEVVVPPTIHALLQARLDQLGGDERSVIERGAVEGEVFHRAPVAELASEGVRTGLDTHLATLIRNELIRPEAATMPGDDAFRFRHLLIRDAAYDSLPKETRADLHECFALWIDEHVQLVEQDEIVGYHLEQAVLYRRELGREDDALAGQAARRLGVAGQSALGRGDNTAAERLLERATKVPSQAAKGRLEFVPDLVLALIERARFDDALAYIDELAASDDERLRVYGTVLSPVVAHIGGTGSIEAGRSALAEGVEAFRRLGDERGLALARTMQGHEEWTACRATAAAERYRAAMAHAETAGLWSLVNEAIGNLCGIALFGPTPVDAAEAEIRTLLKHARGVGPRAAACRSLGRLAAIRGDIEAGRELVRQGRELLTDSGFLLHHAASSMASAFVEEQAGDHESAARIQREGLEELGELGEHAYSSTVAADLAHSLLRLGRDDEAEAALATARELCPPGDIGTLVLSDLAETHLHLRRGRVEDAERAVGRADERAQKTDFWAYLGATSEARALVLAALGRGREATAALESAIRTYREKGARVAEARSSALLAEL
ncbi:MAG: AAA family ATPase [Actinobacteria bacterium]|nr:AAA family ATPase [Actinomycetota bacterium]